ncbi:hypothetical protein O181_091784 [Austropuccinia psidii MF-1]|uniref:Integrase catalytic domain-containing protein n=1 Tax=Austropuccinia psidii MF-1 TaxID=1389203 RepID=A0A9Q3IY90_9BASI|nr:hypothetical protein [Austropuccinia psidii MF-1]
MLLENDVRCPPNDLVNKFGSFCFHCGWDGHWHVDCPHTRGVVNPNPRSPLPTPFCPLRPVTPDQRPQQGLGAHYQQERVSQVQFVKHNASEKVLIDTGASIHLSGAMHFAMRICSISSFRIFFTKSNSSIVILQMTTLKLPINNGFIYIHNMAYSNKVLGTILSVGFLCTAGVVPVFDDLALLLFVSSPLVTTTLKNNCWWLDVLPEEGTKGSEAVTPSCDLFRFEMNPISQPTSTSLSLHDWHKHLGHACDKMVISFLKQHVPELNPKQWQPFYCMVCATAKRTHWIARARTNIPKEIPLDLLVSDAMGPFSGDAQGFCYLVTISDHASTYSMVYPLKSWSDTPNAILDVIKNFQVHLQLTPKALQTYNERELTLSSFVLSLAKLGVGFFPSLTYSPQEKGKAKGLNWTLGDMVQSKMPKRFWHFAYALASFMHNFLQNSRFLHSLPHQQLFGHPPSIATLYPFGVEAIVHIPAVQQAHKLAPRGVSGCLLKPLMLGGWLLWGPVSNKQIQSASVVFPPFQS